MPKSASASGPHDYSATLRQLKALVLILVLSNVGLGVFAFYLLRTTDERYSTLLGRTLPVINDFRELTAHLADAMRATGTPLLNAPESQRAEMVKRARATIQKHRQFRTTVLSDEIPPGAPDFRAKVARQGESFDQFSEEVIALASDGKVKEASDLRNLRLRGLFDEYVGVIGEAAEGIEGATLKANTEMSARVGSLSAVMLGLAGWPVILLFALLVLTAIFVLILMVLFRGREMNDLP